MLDSDGEDEAAGSSRAVDWHRYHLYRSLQIQDARFCGRIGMTSTVLINLRHWRIRARALDFQCDALFERTDEQDAASGPLLQTLEGSSVENQPHDSFLEARNVSTVSSSVWHEKAGANLVQPQVWGTFYRTSSGTGPFSTEQFRTKEHERGQKPNMSQLQLPNKSEKFEAITSLVDDEDICPTCLDGYDNENPKMLTKCGHHFHLACILEWMERSSHCPLCDQEMVIIEPP